MARPNSYGSKANRERRKAVADRNARAKQFNCVSRCGGRHREGRHYR